MIQRLFAGLRGGGGQAERAMELRRLDRIEAKLDLILAYLRLEEEQAAARDPDERVAELVRAGRTVEAMRVYREQTGASAREAYEAVSALAAEQSAAREGGSPAG